MRGILAPREKTNYPPCGKRFKQPFNRRLDWEQVAARPQNERYTGLWEALFATKEALLLLADRVDELGRQQRASLSIGEGSGADKAVPTVNDVHVCTRATRSPRGRSRSTGRAADGRSMRAWKKRSKNQRVAAAKESKLFVHHENGTIRPLGAYD